MLFRTQIILGLILLCMVCYEVTGAALKVEESAGLLVAEEQGICNAIKAHYRPMTANYYNMMVENKRCLAGLGEYKNTGGFSRQTFCSIKTQVPSDAPDAQLDLICKKAVAILSAETKFTEQMETGISYIAHLEPQIRGAASYFPSFQEIFNQELRKETACSNQNAICPDTDVNEWRAIVEASAEYNRILDNIPKSIHFVVKQIPIPSDSEILGVDPRLIRISLIHSNANELDTFTAIYRNETDKLMTSFKQHPLVSDKGNNTHDFTLIKPPFSATPLGQPMSTFAASDDLVATRTPNSKYGGYYGYTRSQGTQFHGGFDDPSSMGLGNEVRYNAVVDGTVIGVRQKVDEGIIVAVELNYKGERYVSQVMHMDKAMVTLGQKVSPGDVLGIGSGKGRQFSSVNSGEFHIHWKLERNGIVVNPLTGLRNSSW